MGKLSDHPLQSYVSLGYDTLVETGTGRGDGLKAAAGYAFKHLFSTELYPPVYQAALSMFAADKRVHLFDLHGPDFIEHLLTTAITPEDKVVWWLDSHFIGADVCGLPFDYEKDLTKRLPLEGELETLLRHKRFHDIILGDDMRLYEKCPMEGGDLTQHGLGHITRYDAPDFLAPWRETHIVEKQYRDTGYVVMMPRSMT